jgi:ATP-dependent exoDNAse (exonuclease V) alpha subunit
MRQKQALSVMMYGANVFLTGAPGAGKTYVLNQFIKRAEAAGKRVAITASTGIAASHLNGTTIHSWSGLGILDSLNEADAERLGSSDKLLKRYNGTDVLVIDEVSMLHGYRLDMINRMAKILRASDKPFGGLQVILVGDLFQLPPVSRMSATAEFVHLSEAWAELELAICYLTEQHRQSSHDSLLELLEAMRAGDLQSHHGDALRERLGKKAPPGTALTRLYAHNVDVESINQRHLGDLDTSAKTYYMLSKGSKHKREQLAKSVLAPEILELKIGAEVMFVANNFAEGFVNGSRGRVTDFYSGLPVVRLLSGRELTVGLHTWSLTEDGRVQAEVSQLPLRLAWAITIHKSQGMSLDAAEVDLSRAFTPGMGYVALSRVRSIDGLYLHGVNATAFQMHPSMDEFDRALRRRSDELAGATHDYVDPEPETAAVSASAVDYDLFDALKAWRLQRAKKDKIAPFMIAHNSALDALATNKPSNERQLLATPGFGKQKVDKYGTEILEIISKHH